MAGFQHSPRLVDKYSMVGFHVSFRLVDTYLWQVFSIALV